MALPIVPPQSQFSRLLDPQTRVRLREQLRQLLAREILCRRAVETGVNAEFDKCAWNGSLKQLIARASGWYEPLMVPQA